MHDIENMVNTLDDSTLDDSTLDDSTLQDEATNLYAMPVKVRKEVMNNENFITKECVVYATAPYISNKDNVWYVLYFIICHLILSLRVTVYLYWRI